MSAGGIDADCANMVQTLYQAQNRGRLCRFRYLAQPDEPALTAFRAALRQSIEPAPLLGQQPAGQPTFNLSSRLMTQGRRTGVRGIEVMGPRSRAAGIPG